MRSITVKRKWQRRDALRNVGVDPDLIRISPQQIRAMSDESRILRLPIDFRYYHPIQDPNTGVLYFMYGVHPYGGLNPFG